MLKKSLVTLSAALVVATALVSATNAQTSQGNGVRPYTAAEKLWFQIPEAPERVN